MPRHALSVSFVSALLAACLEAPAPPPPTDAGSDAGPPSLSVEGARSTDRRGVEWPADAAPRTLRVEIEMSAPLAWPEDEDEAPLVLMWAPDDLDALLEDAERPPLRAAHRALSVPVRREVEGARWTLEPTERLGRGAELVALVAGWARAAGSDRTLGSPFLLPITISSAADAGTEAIASWPADGTSAVSTSLREIALGFDGPIAEVDGVTVTDGAPVPIETQLADCAELALPAHTCLRLTLGRALAPRRTHVVEVSERLRDSTGAAVGPWRITFGTGEGPDVEPPTLLEEACAIDELGSPEGCLLIDDASISLRLLADEPVRATLALAGVERRALAPRGETTLRVDGLPADAQLPGRLTLVDLAGNVESRALELRTAEPMVSLSITEVRADPQGPEPQQEYVEVLNYGDVPLDLNGIALSDRADRPGDVVPRPFVLAPGQRGLLVADRFDPDDPADDVVPPGVPLVRIGASLATGGVTNAGEALYLRDPAGRRISATPPSSVATGRCLVRRPSAPPRGADPAWFEAAACSPGLP